MPISFADLEAHYPAQQQPCSTNGAANFDDQCAIRMGVCLSDAGLELRGFRGARCWHGHAGRHLLRAQELASWLRLPLQTRQFSDARLSRARRTRIAISSADYAGRSGIVFFQNFWGRGNQGDHIDLWDGSDVRTGATDYFSRAEEVWFWGIG